jgi:hypothetical protein
MEALPAIAEYLGSLRRIPMTKNDEAKGPWSGDGYVIGAQDRASLNFMGLSSLGLDLGICFVGDFLHGVLLLNAILGLGFLGLGLSRPQVRLHEAAGCGGLRDGVRGAVAGR